MILEKRKFKRLTPRYFQKLTVKGFMFIAMLLAYTAFLILVVLQERDMPMKQLEDYQHIQKAESVLVQADLAAFHVVSSLFSNSKNNDMKLIVHYFSELRAQYNNLTSLFPEKAASFKQFVDTLTRVLTTPSRENLLLLHQQLTQTKLKIDQLLAENRVKREELLQKNRNHSDHVVITTLTLGITGLMLLGGITSFFFMQLTKDIKLLQYRVIEVMKGYRGTPLPITRNDELGELTLGINHMAQTLKEREKELEIERRKSSYQEKMTAIESLAGGIAHEIGNPIACIEGLALEIQEHDSSQLDDMLKQNIQLILSYAEGLNRITRNLSIISTPNDDQQQLLDFNQLILTVTGLLQYDKRWETIHIACDLETNLPALLGFSDQLSLLLNNLLENARYALDECLTPKIIIQTRLLENGSGVTCTIEDNGKGMSDNVKSRAFEPFYSTKPVGQGAGLGLALCWSIISTHKGAITLDAIPEKGTTIQIQLPINPKHIKELAHG